MFIPPFPPQTPPIRLCRASAPLIGANELWKSQIQDERKKGVLGAIADLSRPQSTDSVATDAFPALCFCWFPLWVMV